MERRERRGGAGFGDEPEHVIGIRGQPIIRGLAERGHGIARGDDLLVLDERTNGWVRIPAAADRRAGAGCAWAGPRAR